MSNRYSWEEIEGFYWVYDVEQDIYVNRYGYVAEDGFFTLNEAKRTILFLDRKK
jgi:hypothetical protein